MRHVGTAIRLLTLSSILQTHVHIFSRHHTAAANFWRALTAQSRPKDQRRSLRHRVASSWSFPVRFHVPTEEASHSTCMCAPGGRGRNAPCGEHFKS